MRFTVVRRAALAALLIALWPAAASAQAPTTAGALCDAADPDPARIIELARDRTAYPIAVQPTAQAAQATAIEELAVLPADAPVRLHVPQAGQHWRDGMRILAVARPTGSDGGAGKLTVLAAETASGSGGLNVRVMYEGAPAQTGWWPWPRHDLYVVGCPGGGLNDTRGAFAFVGHSRVAVSAMWACAGVGLLAVALFYLLAVLAVSRGKHWDPVRITAGVDGRGSISKMQILFFTLIVAGMLTYVLVRVGRLGDLSSDVLLLLGIAGVGGAAVKQASVLKRRLKAENWSWLQEHGWTPPKATPRWADLVMEGREFDIYRFQILIFSLVVGGALLFTGLFGLASFKLPEAMLGLLGLSQVVYLGGKVVAKPEVSELDAQITELRELAAELCAKARRVDANGTVTYEYDQLEGLEKIRSMTADVERLTTVVFGGRKLVLKDKTADALV